MSKRSVDSRGPARESKPAVLPVVAANLARLRVEKGLSLAALAQQSGLSPELLLALSNGDEEPTIKTLWSLANALGVPFRALIAESGGDAGGSAPPQASSRRVLSSRDGARKSEVYEIKLPANAVESAAAQRAGAVENVLVTKGLAEIRTDSHHYTLHEGESVSFRADQARHYESLGDASATLYIVISQPVD